MASRDSASTRIESVARRRGIRFLLHFTLARNLPDIVAHGILPREAILASDITAYVGARRRLDADDRVVSLGVSAVSRNIFAAKARGSSPEDWVVLFVDPSVLWTCACRFCFRSAASREMLGFRGFLGGPWALERMFSDDAAPPSHAGRSYREETGLRSFLTTDPDAEVQIFGPVPPDRIIGAWTCSRARADAIQAQLDRLPGPERDVLVAPFDDPSDGYAAWIVPPLIP